jgi:glutamyl-tRNA reductase
MNLDKTPTKFYNVGLSYKKADVTVRSAFSISKENQRLLIKEALKNGINGVLVLSTCNRTEITGFAKHPFELISLLLKYSKGNLDDFIKVSNVYKNKAAVDHLFNIGTGLDSQILGDYEIVGQLKRSFKLSKKMGATNAYLERLMNLVLHASKMVKNNTKISSGTTSVAYAAIQYIIETIPDYDNLNILTYGLGDIGKNTCKNILEYTSNRNITLINRTHGKALEFGKVHPDVAIREHAQLTQQIEQADILIVSTGSNRTTIDRSHLRPDKELLIIDLSIPENVDLSVKDLPGITLVNVDDLSKITDKTIETRQNEVPKAKEIIATYKNEFNEWIAHRKFVPAVNALKESLMSIQHDEINFQQKKIKDFNIEQAEMITSRMIQKITTQFVKHLKEEETAVDQSISVVSKIFDLKELIHDESN